MTNIYFEAKNYIPDSYSIWTNITKFSQNNCELYLSNIENSNILYFIDLYLKRASQETTFHASELMCISIGNQTRLFLNNTVLRLEYTIPNIQKKNSIELEILKFDYFHIINVCACFK